MTGGGGQLGRAFALVVPSAAVLSRSQLDITQREAVIRTVGNERPRVIVNAAAFTKVDAAEAQPGEARRINAEGARNVAEAAESVGAWLVQVSTDYVYPGDKTGPYFEEDETGPLSVYGITKLEGESAAEVCSNTLIVRTSWVFGDGHNFVRSILGAASGGLSELSIVSDQRGLPTFAPHLAKGILGLVERKATGIYHLAGSGPAPTWADVADLALEAAGLTTKVRRITTADYAASRTGPLAPRPSNSVLDCSKAAALGVSLPPWTGAVSDYAAACAAPANPAPARAEG